MPPGPLIMWFCDGALQVWTQFVNLLRWIFQIKDETKSWWCIFPKGPLTQLMSPWLQMILWCASISKQASASLVNLVRSTISPKLVSKLTVRAKPACKDTQSSAKQWLLQIWRQLLLQAHIVPQTLAISSCKSRHWKLESETCAKLSKFLKMRCMSWKMSTNVNDVTTRPTQAPA